MLQLDKEQCAAFIRDERVLVVFTSSLDAIIPTCHDFEDRLIKLLWRSRPGGTMTMSTTSGSLLPREASFTASESVVPSTSGHSQMLSSPQVKVKKNWYGKKVGVIVPKREGEVKREAKLYAPLYNGLAAGLVLVFVSVKTLIREFFLYQTWTCCVYLRYSPSPSPTASSSSFVLMMVSDHHSLPHKLERLRG